jgi:Arm DNA-binding domain
MPYGAKYWRMKYRYGEKENRLACGVYRETSLKESRDKRNDASKQLTQRIAPGSHRKSAQATQVPDGKLL